VPIGAPKIPGTCIRLSTRILVFEFVREDILHTSVEDVTKKFNGDVKYYVLVVVLSILISTFFRIK
jgi:hypothetical protein